MNGQRASRNGEAPVRQGGDDGAASIGALGTPRQLFETARTGNWWHSKLPPLFAVAYATMLHTGRSPAAEWGALAAAMVTLCVVAWYAHVVNDLSDIEDDARCGKTNRMAVFGRTTGWALAMALFVSGTGLVVWLLPARPGTLLLLALNYLTFTLYSVPPVRLKLRTWWGVAADALGAHVIPSMFVISAMWGDTRPDLTGVALAASILTWSMGAGLRNILIHQLGDREADQKAGIRTVGNTLGLGDVRHLILRFMVPAEAIGLLATVALLIPRAPGLLFIAPAFVLLELFKVRLGWRFRFIPEARQEPEPYRPLLNNDAYELWLPFGLAIALALFDPRYAAIPFIHLALFHRGVGPRARDLARLSKDVAHRAQNRTQNLAQNLARKARHLEENLASRARHARERRAASRQARQRLVRPPIPRRPIRNLHVRRMGARITRLGLTVDRLLDRAFRSMRQPRPRVIATACWTFPIYSQTFVYEELEQLSRNGFKVRLLYTEPTGRDQLGGRYHRLWWRRRRTYLDPSIAHEDLAWFRKRMPERVAELTETLSVATGLSATELEKNDHYRMGFSFARIAAAFRPDYLHSYFFYEGTLFTYVASRLLDVPRGVSCYADHRLNDFPLKMVDRQIRTSEVVVATSRQIGHELEDTARWPGAPNILVKPNAIDTSRFPYVARPEPANGVTIRLVSVCRFDPKKGLHYLIEAVRLLRHRGVAVRLHLVGAADNDVQTSREYGERLEQRVAEFQLGEAVVFEGRCPQAVILRLLTESDVFVAPFVDLESGDSDGIPTALMEAMSTGAPIIATEAGSIGEVIRHEVTGLVVPQHDATAIADAVARLAADPALRGRLGRAAAQLTRETLDVTTCERHFHERVREVIGQPLLEAEPA